MDSRKRSTTFNAASIETIALETPQMTTYIAHQLKEQELLTLIESQNQIERLFGYICGFAKGEIDAMQKFSSELLKFIQRRDLPATHSKMCEYFYTYVNNYLPKQLGNNHAIEAELKKHRLGISRSEHVLPLQPKSPTHELINAVYAWIIDIEKSKTFAPYDGLMLDKITSLLSRRDYYPSIDCMIGHIIARFENDIPKDSLANYRHLSQVQRQQPHNLERALHLLLSGETCLTTGAHLGYEHSGFQLNPPHHSPRRYIELPNATVAEIADIIAKQPEQVIECWLRLKNGFRFSNLYDIYQNHPNLKHTWDESDNQELKTLLAALKFDKMDRQMKPGIANKEDFESAMAQCPERLKMLIVYKYAYACQLATEYDPEFHPVIIDAMQPYLENEKCFESIHGYIQRLRPNNDILELKEQIQDGVSRASETVATTFMAHAKPLAESVSTFSTNLFATVGSALQRVPAPDRDKSINPLYEGEMRLK